MYELILCSQSPRRRKILHEAGYKFSAYTPEISENIKDNMSLDEAIMDIAGRKARANLTNIKENHGIKTLVLASDTVVVLENEVLGKPKDMDQCRDYLSRLSGKTHLVKTAICVLNLQTKEEVSLLETTEVEFKVLLPEQIESYVQTKQSLDKAGGYGIQDEGKNFVKEIRGDYNNVVGLPLKKLEDILSQRGWHVRC